MFQPKREVNKGDKIVVVRCSELRKADSEMLSLIVGREFVIKDNLAKWSSTGDTAYQIHLPDKLVEARTGLGAAPILPCVFFLERSEFAVVQKGKV